MGLSTQLVLAAAALSPQATQELESWRAQQDRQMRAADSPLAYLGSRGLSMGHNTLGSGREDALRFGSPGVPERALDLIAERGPSGVRVTLVPLVGMVALDDQPADVNAPLLLKKGARVEVGPLQLRFQGGTQFSISDRARPRVLSYQGLRYLPVDARYRVEATFTSAGKGKTLKLETSQGAIRELPLQGVLHFSVMGRDLSLEGFELGERPRDLFVVFRDATSGKETYGAGRFLWVKEPVDGKAVVDFNQAWNPLCAYSPDYNCPIPPSENRLPIPIPVGEADYGHGP